MINLTKQISALESRHRSETSAAVALALRSWQAFRFLEPEHEMRILLQRANHAVIAAHRRNLVHTKLYALTIFIAIEAGHYDSANGMLDKAMGYKSFLKATEPFFYGILCFLYAYLELNQKRARSAKKHRRALTDHIKTAHPSPHYDVMQGLLHLAACEFPEAYKFLTDALTAGVNSVFLYEGLFRYYKTAPSGVEGMSILPVLTYAALRGVDIVSVAAKYPETLSAAILADPEAGEKLYAASGYPPILKDICTHRIAKGDMSAEAFEFYRSAEKRQIYTPELFNTLIRAAYENKAHKLNHFPIKKFLASGDLISDPGFAVYVYHFLLTDTSLSDLLPEAQSKILQLGTRCLENDIRGREANSIYYYLWSRFRALGITGVNLDKAEAILRENLTLFELRTEENSAVRFVYITEPEKRGMEVYEVESPAGLIIEAVSANASYTRLGAGQSTILDEELTIKPMIGQAGPEIYLYFFQKGDRRFNLLAYLANYYFSLETPPDEAIPVFEALILEKRIAKPYRMRILIALGRLHYNAFSFDQALECYGEVDEDAIGNDFIPQLLSVYLQTREFSRAAKLLSKKQKYISNEILFEAVNILLAAKTEKEKIAETIAGIAYNLILQNCFCENLLNFVLENYPASYSELAALSQTIDEDNRISINLDARVLETALYMSCFDHHAQKAFTRLYGYCAANNFDDISTEPQVHLEAGNNFPHNKKTSVLHLIDEFTALASYEMLANFIRPNYDVLGILEKIYLQNRNVLFAWGLAGVYLRYNITTFKSDEIIQTAISALENEGILFPVFKENKPTLTPFIEKFQPFLYKCLPEKDCWLYYRIDGAAAFSSVPMQYVRYGIYVAAVPMFYNETLTSYFSEELPSGSITTKEHFVKNTKPFLHESQDDSYFTINNALVYEQMFKYDKVETLIGGLVKDIQPVRAKLL